MAFPNNEKHSGTVETAACKIYNLIQFSLFIRLLARIIQNQTLMHFVTSTQAIVTTTHTYAHTLTH